MADGRRVPTAVGEPINPEEGRVGDRRIQLGQPPIVLEGQEFGYVQLETPEELRQWEEDVRKVAGISLDASNYPNRCCETCTCGCSDKPAML